MNRILFALLALCGAGAALVQPNAALAQPYPSKPIRIVVPFSPGGPTDVVARLIGPKMTESLGQPIIIENKAGAGGNLGVAQVARAPADGYTLLVTSSSFAVNPALSPDARYDREKDFIPIAVMGWEPNFIVVNASFPAKSLAELLQMARTQPLAFASPSSGTTPHLTAENLFKVRAKVEITHVPFRGAGDAAAAVLAGQPPLGPGPRPGGGGGARRRPARPAAHRLDGRHGADSVPQVRQDARARGFLEPAPALAAGCS